LLIRGKAKVALTLEVPKEGNYTAKLGLAHGLAHSGLEVTVPEGMLMRGREIPPGRPGFLECREAADLHLREGKNTLYLRLLDGAGSESQAVLDFIRLEPLERRAHAMEAEEMKVLAVHRGQSVLEHFTLPWSNGAQLKFSGEGEESFLELSFEVAAEGAYTITGICSRTSEYGPFTLAVDDAPLTAAVDPSKLGSKPLGTFTTDPLWLKKGSHSLTVATRAVVGLDCFTLNWRLGMGDVREGEELKVVDFFRGEHSTQGLDRRFSNEKQLWFRGKEDGAFIEVELPVEADGVYRLKIFYCMSWDYGMVAVFLDGEPLGEPFDGYSARIVPSGAIDYGSHTLTAGTHRLRFLLMDKHDLSGGYFMGVDGLTLDKE
jgi:hypothetical protein